MNFLVTCLLPFSWIGCGYWDYMYNDVNLKTFNVDIVRSKIYGILIVAL